MESSPTPNNQPTLDDRSHLSISQNNGSNHVEATFSGPLPPPSVLAGYERAQHGAADRIIKMVEAQANHRQSLERTVTNAEIHHEKIGMWFAFLLTMFLMGFGFFLVWQGKDTVGYLSIFIPVLFHAGNYLYNRSKDNQQTAQENSNTGTNSNGNGKNGTPGL